MASIVHIKTIRFPGCAYNVLLERIVVTTTINETTEIIVIVNN